MVFGVATKTASLCNATVVFCWIGALNAQDRASLPFPNDLARSTYPMATNETITLLGYLNIPDGYKSDVWGYFDAATGKEYALIGNRSTADLLDNYYLIVDVTNPANPAILTSVKSAPGYSIKTWKHYAYSVSGSPVRGSGQIVDISDPANPKGAGSFPSAHTVSIAQDGYLYLSDVGLRAYDLNQDPTKPAFVWSDGKQGGHDVLAVGNRLYDFHGSDGTFIYDITSRAHPELMGSIVDPTIKFHHSGWISEDGRYLFICDEAATHPKADITIWDISEAADPKRVGAFADSLETVHNLYIIGQYAYVSYYGAGFRVFDVSDAISPKIVGEFATTPHPPQVRVLGAFGCFPFAPSGNIYVSDITNGLFIFSFNGEMTGVGDAAYMSSSQFILHQNYPNPFNAATVIGFELPEPGFVSLRIFDLNGREVATPIARNYPSGRFGIKWETGDIASGFYFYQLQTRSFTETKRLLLLK